MAAAGKLLAPLQDLHGAVAPADIVGSLPLRLVVQHGPFREGVIGHEAEVLAVPVGDDEAVELPVVLEHTAPVDAGDALFPVDDGVGADPVRAIEHHRPVAHHHPAVEVPAQGQEMVHPHQLLHGVGPEGLVRPHPRVGEDEALALQGVGQVPQEGPLRREGPEKLLLGGGKILQLKGVQPGGVAHVPQQPALAPEQVLQHLLVALRVPVRQKDVVPVVTVAAEHVGVPLPAQLHQDPQHPQALRTLFQKVPVHDQLVPGGEARPAQDPLEIGHVAVNVRDHQQPASGLGPIGLDPRRPDHRSSRLSVSGRSNSSRPPCSPASRSSSRKPSLS